VRKVEAQSSTARKVLLLKNKGGEGGHSYEKKSEYIRNNVDDGTLMLKLGHK
jgi:hypothetical protein